MTTHEPQQPLPQRRLTVTRGALGWAVKEERDTEIVRETVYTDWHRVERAMQVFDLRYSTNR